MKKSRMIGLIVILICLSFFTGRYFRDSGEAGNSKRKYETMIALSADKLEDLKAGYNADIMEALISNVYAAYIYSDYSEQGSALYALWNALVFDGENIAGKEDDLKQALQADDLQKVQDIAAGIRTQELTRP